MSKEEFNETVKQFKEAIPSVYEQVKHRGESFFVDGDIGPTGIREGSADG